MSPQSQQATMPPYPRQSPEPHVAKIELFVQPSNLDDLKEAIVEWTSSLVWSEVDYHLDESQVVGIYRGSEYVVDSAPMVKVEAFVSTRLVGNVVAAIGRVLPSAGVHGQVFAVLAGEELVASAPVKPDVSEATGHR